MIGTIMTNQKLRWTGLIISTVMSLFFAFNVLVKLFPETFYPQMVEQMAGIGLPATLLPTIALLEGLCVVVYLIPATSVLGAVLFTGYLGGAILAHLRVGEPAYVQLVLGGVIWLGLYLREPRLRNLIPIRKGTN
jgi:hypothetical protein